MLYVVAAIAILSAANLYRYGANALVVARGAADFLF